MTRRLRLLAVAAGTLLALPASAQQLAPKTSLAARAPTGCAAFQFAAPATSAAPDDAETQRLIDDGNEAALQGEHAAARDAFARAAARSPGNSRLAYYLGREHEALQSPAEAVREYCRYLALSPAAPDADEIRGRIVRLVPASELARLDEARANFRSGVALLTRRQYGAADSVFSAVAVQIPTAPEVFFNRGLARAARGARAGAIEDFERYLELVPQGPERAAIRQAMTRLQARVYNPGQALGSGLVFPGMGQMNTGRPVIGVLVLAAVSGAAIFGMTESDRVKVTTFNDPFGNPYVDSVTSAERPNLAVAAASAAVLWLGSAFEAMTYARRTRARAEAIIQLAGRSDAPPPGTPGSLSPAAAARLAARAAPEAGGVVPYVAPAPRGGVRLGLSLSFGGR